MRIPGQLGLVLVLCLIGVAGLWGRDAQPPTLPHLLTAAASYVTDYEARTAALVFEEVYTQSVSGPNSGVFVSAERRLKSEVVVVNTEGLGWLSFRDVLEVDGKPIRDRRDRFQRLFGQPVTQTVIDQARVIANESARFNLGSVGRNFNYPTMALMFLRQKHQSRSVFSREGTARVGGVVTWMLAFEEAQRPTLVGSPGNEAVASGRFWIEPDSGRVRQSRITIDVTQASCAYDVEYGNRPGIDVLVPVSMDENITLRGRDPRAVQTIRGEARYSNFREFRGTARIKDAIIQP